MTKKKIIISIVVGAILCLGLIGVIITSIINKRNAENADAQLQQQIEFVNNIYNDMKDTKSTFNINLSTLQEKKETFELKIDEFNKSFDNSNGEQNTELLDLEETYYFFESDLDYFYERYNSFDSQLTDITDELSNPNLDFNKLSNDTLEALNDWSEYKIEMTNSLNSLNEKASSLENLINSFDNKK